MMTNGIFVDKLDKRWRHNAGEFYYRTTCRRYRFDDEKLGVDDERRERLRWIGGGGEKR